MRYINAVAGGFSRSLASYEIVTPVRVHKNGNHLSHLVSHSRTPETQRRRRKPRDVSGDLDPDPDLDLDAVHYSVTVDGAELRLDLFPNDRLFAPGLVVERRGRRGGGAEKSAGEAWHRDTRAELVARNRCHFAGKVRGRPDSTVALATCDGLVSSRQVLLYSMAI